MVELGPISRPVDGTPRARLTDALRALIAEVTSGDLVGDDDATNAAQRLDAIRTDLSTASSGRQARDSRSPDRYQLGNPVSGALNPISAPLTLEAVEGAESGHLEVRGQVTFGAYFEGPPGLVHGGHVAAVLDESLGIANYVADMGALTGTLTVRYRKPTPLRSALRVEARFLRSEGRKIYTWAGLFQEDELLAEAEGLFISIPPGMFAAMNEKG
jgi:acyl-coenzyme A thioesterase PaaI-like protein